jgi:hypothetical protein
MHNQTAELEQYVSTYTKMLLRKGIRKETYPGVSETLLTTNYPYL